MGGKERLRYLSYMTSENSADLGEHAAARSKAFSTALSLVIRILECETFCSWNGESWALESGIQLRECGIQYLESKIQRVELSWRTSHGTSLVKYAHLLGLMIRCRSRRLITTVGRRCISKYC